MITEFVRAWEARKTHLEKWFRAMNQENLSYDTILKAIIDEVINPFVEDKWDSSAIHMIDDGDYQGCQIFVVPMDTYQPAPWEYFMTYQFYGSCSGCDLLEGIRRYDGGTPTEKQIKEYMTLALHLLQRCRCFTEWETMERKKRDDITARIPKETLDRIRKQMSCKWYCNGGDCGKGLPGTPCKLVGCVAWEENKEEK